MKIKLKLSSVLGALSAISVLYMILHLFLVNENKRMECIQAGIAVMGIIWGLIRMGRNKKGDKNE